MKCAPRAGWIFVGFGVAISLLLAIFVLALANSNRRVCGLSGSKRIPWEQKGGVQWGRTDPNVQCALSLCSHAGEWYCFDIKWCVCRRELLGTHVYSVLVLVLKWKLLIYICKRTSAHLQNKIGLQCYLDSCPSVKMIRKPHQAKKSEAGPWKKIQCWNYKCISKLKQIQRDHPSVNHLKADSSIIQSSDYSWLSAYV